MPHERLRSLKYARDFLRRLLDPKQSPKVPKAMRKEAYHVLRHFPSAFEVERLSQLDPKTWGAPVSDKKCNVKDEK